MNMSDTDKISAFSQEPQRPFKVHVQMARRSSRREELTNGEAVGASRMESSSLVNGNRGIRRALRGRSNIMMTGNPIAAVVI